jgi:hypothetical protein
MGTDILAARDRGIRRRWLTGRRLAHAAKRQRTKSGESAGDQTRMAQEGPTIKTTVGLAHDCRGAFTAPDLPF